MVGTETEMETEVLARTRLGNVIVVAPEAELSKRNHLIFSNKTSTRPQNFSISENKFSGFRPGVHNGVKSIDFTP